MIYRYCDVSIKNLFLKACRFFKNSILFYNNGIYIRKIAGTVIGTIFAAAGSKLIVAHKNN